MNDPTKKQTGFASEDPIPDFDNLPDEDVSEGDEEDVDFGYED